VSAASLFHARAKIKEIVWQFPQLIPAQKKQRRGTKKRNKEEPMHVTCYPFYFVGSAPKRYIIRASMADDPRRVF
jgi:sortase (surface protein transpeptidase)